MLHFGQSEVYWECKELPFASELFPGGLDPWDSNVDTVPFDIVAQRPGTETETVNWPRLAYQYNKCSLSYPVKDKFIALAAIAERVFATMKREWAAGLIKNHLPRSLLWSITQTKTSPVSVWTGEYRAPTWSWLNIDGPVNIILKYPFDHPVNFMEGAEPSPEELLPWDNAVVKDLQIELLMPNNTFGPIKSARIVLEGRLFSEAFMKELHLCWKGEQVFKEGDDKYIKMRHVMDSQTFDGEMPFLFPIGRNWTIHGLFLKPEGESAEEVYSRLGYFEIDIGDVGAYWSTKQTEILGEPKTVTLI